MLASLFLDLHENVIFRCYYTIFSSSVLYLYVSKPRPRPIGVIVHADRSCAAANYILSSRDYLTNPPLRRSPSRWADGGNICCCAGHCYCGRNSLCTDNAYIQFRLRFRYHPNLCTEMLRWHWLFAFYLYTLVADWDRHETVILPVGGILNLSCRSSQAEDQIYNETFNWMASRGRDFSVIAGDTIIVKNVTRSDSGNYTRTVPSLDGPGVDRSYAYRCLYRVRIGKTISCW